MVQCILGHQTGANIARIPKPFFSILPNVGLYKHQVLFYLLTYFRKEPHSKAKKPPRFSHFGLTMQSLCLLLLTLVAAATAYYPYHNGYYGYPGYHGYGGYQGYPGYLGYGHNHEYDYRQFGGYPVHVGNGQFYFLGTYRGENIIIFFCLLTYKCPFLLLIHNT